MPVVARLCCQEAVRLTLTFEHQKDFVEIELGGQESDGLPARGDAWLSIRIASAGFAGHNEVWVLAVYFIMLRLIC